MRSALPARRGRSFPNLTAHDTRMMEHPAVQQTIEIEAAIGYELPA
jgi:glutathione S-transferase